MVFSCKRKFHDFRFRLQLFNGTYLYKFQDYSRDLKDANSEGKNSRTHNQD